ncbi:MAG: metallophosphoesterase family protein [Candidatus Thorarchaeota archaeon]
MRILAVADVHCPRYLHMFEKSLAEMKAPDLFLLAGDMIDRGRISQYDVVLNAIKERFDDDFPIVACFGNEEYLEVRDEIADIFGDRISFLDDQSIVLEIQGIRFGIVGTQGSLDQPTRWQKQNLPRIKRVFGRRPSRVEHLLKKLSRKTDYQILLMHYAPCLETCEGANDRSFGAFGSKKFYRMIEVEKPNLVIHGHVHDATRQEARMGPTLVRNVALPAAEGVTGLKLSMIKKRESGTE